MSVRPLVVSLVALCALAASLPAASAPPRKTVCTITVNSADEKDALRRHLPPGRYDFVELVERGEPRWLEASCKRGVRCDILVISGHYDGGNEFFPDGLATHEYLPVDELERVSCSDSCPTLFSQLKEVYLFGCNTLSQDPNAFASAELGRSLLRAGHSRADAQRMARDLARRHAESSRDRMRLVFDGVPVIYGFSSVAPLGPVAGSILDRYLQAGGAGEIGSGRASARLLGHFSAHAMTATSGMTAQDPMWAHRRDVCQFADDRLAPAAKLDFVRSLLDRDMAEARMFLPRLERLAAALAEDESPDVAQSLARIASDDAARDRYLAFARDADSPAVRARMIALAGRLGWLTPEDERDELVRMFDDQLAKTAISPAEVDLACALNKDGELDGLPARLRLPDLQAQRVPESAVLACLGQDGARARVLRALTSPREDDVRFAHVYLRHRPLADQGEVRVVTDGIARMNGGIAQMRALHALSSQRLTDPESMTALMRLYPVADSPGVQTAIAGVLLRSEYRAIASPELVHTLRTRRLVNGPPEDAIDVLIRRLQM